MAALGFQQMINALVLFLEIICSIYFKVYQIPTSQNHNIFSLLWKTRRDIQLFSAMQPSCLF